MTPRHARFVQAIVKGKSATEAALDAGYSAKSAGGQGYRLLKNAQIQAAIAKAHDKAEIEAVEVLRELRRIALADVAQAFTEDGALKNIHDIPEDLRRAISGLDVEALWEGHGDDREQVGTVRKVRFWSKTEALRDLAKHLKLLTDKVEHSGDITIVIGDAYAEPGDG